MKKLICLVLLLSSTILLHAQKMKGVKGSKKIITITRTTSDYEKINIEGSFDVKLVAGKEGTITIKGAESILPSLKTEVKNGVLYLKMEKNNRVSNNYNSALEVIVPFVKIEQLIVSGSGNVTNGDSITNSDFSLAISGSGNVAFVGNFTSLKIVKSGSGNLTGKGETKNLEVVTSGSGNANLFDLNAKNTTATLSGSGNINVFTSKNLEAKTAGSGSVYYKGNPADVNKMSAGSGGVFAK